MAWEYSDKTKILFLNAVNGEAGSHFGEIADPDGVGEHGSIACGDAMRFAFKVRKNEDPLKDVITEAKYSTFGCTSAIAASEALCCLIEQGEYSPIDALKIRNDDIVKFLEGLPSQKIHCSVMGAEALEAAVADWAQRRGVDLKAMGIEVLTKENDESPIVCHCFNITSAEIKRKIVELNLKSCDDVAGALKAGGACGACRNTPGGIQDILDEHWGKRLGLGKANLLGSFSLNGGEQLSPFQLSKRIESVLDEDVRPALKADGGDIELVDIKGHLVYVSLLGACSTCPGASVTLSQFIEKTLQKKISTSLKVIDI